jgi:hypothetical protein
MKQLLEFSLAIAIALLTISCEETKTSQCQKIFQIATKLHQEKKNDADKKELNSQDWLKSADNLEKAAQDIKDLNIKDTQLLEYKNNLFQVYTSYSKATRDMVTAIENKDIDTAILAKKNVKNASDLEKKVGVSIDNYCATK